jgi:hypothetical protein
MYLSRKSFAFNSDAPGSGMMESRAIFEKSLATADATFQNLDSSEISLTDVSHYFDSDPTKLVQGLRKDGKKPNSYIADTTTANAQVGRDIPQVAIESGLRCDLRGGVLCCLGLVEIWALGSSLVHCSVCYFSEHGHRLSVLLGLTFPVDYLWKCRDVTVAAFFGRFIVQILKVLPELLSIASFSEVHVPSRS